MYVFHWVGERFARISSDHRLPPWLSIILIIALSALCWAALVALVVAVRRSLKRTGRNRQLVALRWNGVIKSVLLSGFLSKAEK